MYSAYFWKTYENCMRFFKNFLDISLLFYVIMKFRLLCMSACLSLQHIFSSIPLTFVGWNAGYGWQCLIFLRALF